MKWETTRVTALLKIVEVLLGGNQQMQNFFLDKIIDSEKIEAEFESELKSIENINTMISNLFSSDVDETLSPTPPPGQIQNFKTTVVSCFAPHFKFGELKELLPDAEIGKGTYRSASENSADSQFKLYRTRKVT